MIDVVLGGHIVGGLDLRSDTESIGNSTSTCKWYDVDVKL